jgi:hypothetical protein
VIALSDTVVATPTAFTLPRTNMKSIASLEVKALENVIVDPLIVNEELGFCIVPFKDTNI